jgi:hypothetical protein
VNPATEVIVLQDESQSRIVISKISSYRIIQITYRSVPRRSEQLFLSLDGEGHTKYYPDKDKLKEDLARLDKIFGVS